MELPSQIAPEPDRERVTVLMGLTFTVTAVVPVRNPGTPLAVTPIRV